MDTHPKNTFKYCLCCGSNKVNYKPNNSLHCQACNFQFFVNAAAAVAVLILNEKGELLLTKRAFEPSKGTLDLPGGFVDINESAEQALRRELREELQVEVTNIQYLGSYPNEYVYSGLTIFTLDMAFACRAVDFKTLKANDDVADFAFYPLSEINLDKIGLTSIRNIIKDFINSHRLITNQ